MVEIIRLLARPQWETERFNPREVSDQKQRQDLGLLPPDEFSSWDEYWAAVAAERRRLTTFTLPETVPRGRKVSMVWTRDGEDVATIGMHFLSQDGSVAADFLDANEATLNARLLTLWDAIKEFYGSQIALDRLIWHRWGNGVRRPNPASNEYAIVPPVAGDDAPGTQLPPQSACSVTFKTAVRKQWGRVYLPAMSENTTGSGRFTEATCDAVRTAFGDLIDGANTDHLPLVIWSPRHGGNALSYGDGTPAGRAAAHDAGLDNPDNTSFARSVLQVQVDDVIDTIRSRRFAKPLVRATHTL